jgi:hypothetical protein
MSEENVEKTSTTEDEEEDPPRNRLERAYQKFLQNETVETLDLSIKSRNKQAQKFNENDFSKVGTCSNNFLPF